MTSRDDDRPTIPARRAGVVHLAVPGAGEMLLDEPQACPTFPGLLLDGLAVAPGGQHYLTLTVHPPNKKPTFRLYVGPDPDTIARRGLILVAALRSHGGDLATPETGIGVLAWLAACWTEAAAEIDHASCGAEHLPTETRGR